MNEITGTQETITIAIQISKATKLIKKTIQNKEYDLAIHCISA
jgi:hypothetical protein